MVQIFLLLTGLKAFDVPSDCWTNADSTEEDMNNCCDYLTSLGDGVDTCAPNCDWDQGYVNENATEPWYYITRLELSNCFKSTTVPQELAYIQGLTFLDLSHNGLAGSLPSNMENLTSLEVLKLNNNYLTGFIPRDVANMHSLTYLDMSSNYLTGPIPQPRWSKSQTNQTTMWPELEYLDLSDNNLLSYFPRFLAKLSNLRTLKLNGNNLMGPMFKNVSGLTALEVFDVSDNLLWGTLNSGFQDLKNLVVMDVSNNDLGGSIGHAWDELSNLVVLDLSSNHFRGSLPAGFLSGLNGTRLDLDFSFNEFSGPFPNSVWAKAGNIRRLSMAFNSFSGEIPTDSSIDLSQLEILDMGFNQFSGSIPEDIYESENLVFLNLADNDFSGTLCNNCFSAWYDQLLIANFSHNRFSGGIPSNLKNLENLIILDLSFNKFSGSVPDLSPINEDRGIRYLSLGGNYDLSCPVDDYSTYAMGSDYIKSYASDGNKNCGGNGPPSPSDEEGKKSHWTKWLFICFGIVLGLILFVYLARKIKNRGYENFQGARELGLWKK